MLLPQQYILNTMQHQHSVVCSAVSAIIIILLVVLAALFGGSSNQGSVEINDVVHDDINEVVPSSSSSSSIPLPYETKLANNDNSRYSLSSSVSNNQTSNNITTSPTVKPTVITWRPTLRHSTPKQPTLSFKSFIGRRFFKDTTSNEASGTNYTAKGASLTRVDPTTSGTTAFTDFADLTFSNATVTANGCMIFNDSASGDPAVCILAFGGDKTSTAGDFTIQFPTADASNAIIRIA